MYGFVVVDEKGLVWRNKKLDIWEEQLKSWVMRGKYKLKGMKGVNEKNETVLGKLSIKNEDCESGL